MALQTAPVVDVAVADLNADKPSSESMPFVMFENVPLAPPNKIFHLAAQCKADENPDKLNLGVGAFRDDAGRPVVMTVVQETEEEMAREVVAGKLNHEYPPMGGSQILVNAAARLALGPDSDRLALEQVQGVQALSGTGALRLAAEFIARYHSSHDVLITNPTWANHPAIFREAGLKPSYMRYYDESTLGLDFDGLLADLNKASPGTTVVLHACAHNPTGVDPSEEQWQAIAQVCQERRLLTVFDCAYLGFVTGDPDQDAFAMRHWSELGLSFFICMSFSKNFGLYSERCGVTLYIGSSVKEANAVNSQLKVIGRPIWSVPPMHGATIVERILTDDDLHKKWRYELQSQADRILRMRRKLYEGLKKNDPEHNWDHIINQTGMFTYTGLSKEQCQELIDDYSVYLLDTGRINVSGIPADRVDYLVDAICAVVNTNADAASLASSEGLDSGVSGAEETPSAKL
eukprot:TRINITY_DN9952_c0_g1_i2.p1 TRINITY_DN9952_c0_g1~~TRINITY_DN9952_c0_g1_i2.p1  ORF type:complete len:507 (+),score=115.98 TRINITY_DN9952_c0_g1_i2:139-1521(+)